MENKLIIIPADCLPAPDMPRGLPDSRQLTYRKMLSDSLPMARLNDMVADLRAKGRGAVPDFDSLDGGVRARILFLMEKPGPMTDADRPGRAGSGFISRDNDDESAAATFTFMQQIPIMRNETLIWNAIPWWNGRIKVTPEEWRVGLLRLEVLLNLLPRLQSVVLVGRKAARAANMLAMRDLRVWHSAHPSPRVKARYPDQHAAIPGIWAKAVTSLN
ncbi:MAG: uracil-DNA glycosylase [Alphaproteobacteria bacterium]|nr:uracil-DNA glycosylase [Alphaproteobacteria bacterium]